MTTDGAILPPMLSPTLPSEWELPEPLSPTIPSEFDFELAKPREAEPAEVSEPLAAARPKKKPTNGQAASRSASVEAKPKKVAAAPVQTSPPPRKIVVLRYPVKKAAAPPKLAEPDRAASAAPQAEETNPVYKALRSKMHHWVDLARKKKHEADAAASNRQHHQAAVAGLDSALCFIRAFDFEDRAEQAVSRDAHARSWTTLVPYLGKMATYLESIDSDIAGMCYQVLAVVNIRISLVRQGSRDAPLAAQRAIQEFRRGLALLPHTLIEEKYELRWNSTKLNSKGCDPVNDRATLPLHVNTSPQEAAALALHMGREWAQQEGISYEWNAAEPL